MLETSINFRGLSQALNSMKGPSGEPTPSHTTIINWVHKVGYHRLAQQKKEKAEDWILILDHSIQIGKEKVLVILGVRESQLTFDRSLQFQDLIPLKEIAREKWNGERIKKILKEVEKKIGKVQYAVADKGSDIRKGLELAGIKQVYDITHQIAATLKKLFKEDEKFKELMKKMSECRLQCQQTELSYLIPPNQRSKSRFENIGSIAQWGRKIISYLNQQKNRGELPKKVDEKFSWVYEYEEIIKELSEINESIRQVQRIVKTKGLSEASAKECNKYLNELGNARGEKVKNELNEYFKNTLSRLPYGKILCSSDILESAFGRYKNYVSRNSMAGITNLVLVIPAFTSQLGEDEIEKALNEVTIEDVKKWTKANIGKSVFQKRRESFACV